MAGDSEDRSRSRRMSDAETVVVRRSSVSSVRPPVDPTKLRNLSLGRLRGLGDWLCKTFAFPSWKVKVVGERLSLDWLICATPSIFIIAVYHGSERPGPCGPGFPPTRELPPQTSDPPSSMAGL